MKRNEITQEEVRGIFDYKDGVLYWRVRGSNRRMNQPAGSIRTFKLKKGIKRRIIGVNGRYYIASRLIFIWHHGYLPHIVDHIDRNTLNDRIENLRAATDSQNQANRLPKASSTSIYMGVSIKKSHKYKKWHAQISKDKIRCYIGDYLTENEAALAYNKAAVKEHGEFAYLNIIKP